MTASFCRKMRSPWAGMTAAAVRSITDRTARAASQVYGTGKENHSTAQAAGIVNMEEFGTYLGNGTYSYSVVNGLVDYAFHSQEVWDAEGMKALVANGVINGTSDTTLAPQDPCTVEQGILLLYRLYEKI